MTKTAAVFIVTIEGKEVRKFAFNKGLSAKKIIGKDKTSADIVINQSFISRKHLELLKDEYDNLFVTDLDSTNGVFVNGKRITPLIKTPVKKGDIISFMKSSGVQLLILDPEEKANDSSNSNHLPKLKSKSKIRTTTKNNKRLIDLLSQKDSIIIGRSSDADVLIKDNIVSRQHARIFKEGDKYYLEDLNSTNGVFINGKKAEGKTIISSNDEIRIGLNLFKLNDDLNRDFLDRTNLTAIRAESITKKFKNGYVGVHPMSFSIPARSFIAVMGPSGCGKTTLMNMLNGANPATRGKVYIHGLELSSNFELLKQKIGYVPQEDIVHNQLTVNQSLFYAAKLKMNEDTTNKEIWQRIEEVCKNLNINEKEIRENKVENLSGGQKKRISIAVELLNNPSVLFLDEPTSPLDPETIVKFLKSIKELTVLENTTVIMVTHKPMDLLYTDKVLFLAKKGYPAYYDNEENLYHYFGLNEGDIVGVYSSLDESKKIQVWYDKWQVNHKPVKVKEDPSQINKKNRNSLIRQYFWLTRRYANIKINDKDNIVILMTQPLIIPIALIYIFSELRLGVLFLMAVSAVWFGVSNAAKEIVEEIPIYRRERMFNLRINPYLFSKITVLSIIALVQVSIFIFILKLKYSDGDIELVNTSQMLAFMFYLAFSATLLGLLLSAVFKNSNQVMSIIPIILIPQIIFAGVIANIDRWDKELISYTMLSRWGTEGLARIQNDYPDYTETAYSTNDYLLINNNDNQEQISLTTLCEENKSGYDHLCESEIKSVFEKVPDFHMSMDTSIVIDQSNPQPYTWQKEYKNIKANPLKILGFYENSELFNVFDGLRKNIIAITIINILTFMLIYISLRRKDKI